MRHEGEVLKDRNGARWAETRFRNKRGQPQGTRVSGGAFTQGHRPGRQQELNGLTSGWCEGESGELQMHIRDLGCWGSATMCLIPGFSAYFPFLSFILALAFQFSFVRKPQDAWSISWCQHHGEGSLVRRE